MRFVISCFGNALVPLLAVCLRSLRLTHPDDRVTVLHDDLRPSRRRALMARNPGVAFVDRAVEGSSIRRMKNRISAKLEHWAEYLAGSDVPDGQVVVFLDADMIVYRNIAACLPADFDVLFTWKDEAVPINTGLVAVKASAQASSFMREWGRLTLEINRDPVRLDSARRRMGGADQEALWQLMGPPAGSLDGPLTVQFPFGPIRFFGVPCALLNQTNPSPVDCGSLVFHYKSSWHPVLLRGRPFGGWVPRQTSEEMYRLWQAYFAEEERAMGMHLLPVWVRLRQALARQG